MLFIKQFKLFSKIECKQKTAEHLNEERILTKYYYIKELKK